MRGVKFGASGSKLLLRSADSKLPPAAISQATVSVWCRKNKKHSLVINKIANGVKVQEKSSCQEKLLSASEREKKKTITQKFYTEEYWQSNY